MHAEFVASYARIPKGIRMEVSRKKGFCVVFLMILISMMLLNINICCGAVSLEINSSTTTSWFNGSIEESLTLDLDFDLYMEPEFSRMLKGNDHLVNKAGDRNKPVVNGGKGQPYFRGSDKNRESRYKKNPPH